MDALEKYYLDNFEYLKKKIKNRAGTIWNAEDIIQESFYRAIKYWSSFDQERGRIDTWFGTILNNTLKDYMKSDRLLGMAYEIDEDKIEPVEVDWDELTKDRDVDSILAGKVGFRKQVLELALKFHYNTQEIAQLTDGNKHTISQYLWEFKQELKT
jgi:RNA polymerase sigma factor (sigma-70 family)